MTSPVRLLVVAVLVAALGPPARAADNPDAARRAALAKSGYVAVPLELDPKGLSFYVDGVVGTEKVKFLLDSGQHATMLDGPVVKRLGLKLGEPYQTVGLGGVSNSHWVEPAGLTLSTVDTRKDFPKGINALSVDGLQLRNGATGVLGAAMLDMYGAVVDYPARTLYLRPPVAAAWPRLAGKWAIASRQVDGEVPPPNPTQAVAVEFVGDRVRFTGRGGQTEELAVHLYPAESGAYQLLLFDPKTADKPEYEDAMLVKVDGDTMTACVIADPDKAMDLPTEFAAPKGSGYALWGLKRTTPTAAPPADPLREPLVKGGYTAVPLGRELEGKRVAVARVGGHDLRLMADTGASVSFFDRAGLKTWGAKRLGGLDVETFRGTAAAEDLKLRGLRLGGYDTRRAWAEVYGAASDLTAVNKVVADKKGKPSDGILGNLDLLNGSAVVDYHTDTLYLRPVNDTVWPQLAGKWAGVAWEQDGRKGRYAPGAAAVEFADGRVRFAANGKTAEWGFHVRDEARRYRVGLFDPAADVLADGFEYGGRGLLKLDGGKLVVLLERGRAKVGDDLLESAPFASPPGSGLLVVEYERAE